MGPERCIKVSMATIRPCVARTGSDGTRRHFVLPEKGHCRGGNDSLAFAKSKGAGEENVLSNREEGILTDPPVLASREYSTKK